MRWDKPNVIDQGIEKQKRSSIASRFIGVIAFCYAIAFFGFQDRLNRFALLKENNGQWERVSSLQAHAISLTPSSDGSVLVKTLHPPTLSLLVDGNWKQLSQHSLPFGANPFISALAISHSTIWAVSEEGVASYFAGKWTKHNPPIDYSGKIRIVAADEKVWILDARGRLSHYDGSKWITLVDSGKPHADIACDDDSLRISPLYEVWFTCSGIWKFNSGEWKQIQFQNDNFYYHQFFAFASSAAWTRDHGYIFKTPFDNAPIERMESTSVGLPKYEELMPIPRDSGDYWVYARNVLYSWNGTGWEQTRTFASSPNDFGSVQQIVADKQGNLWALSEDRGSWWRWAWLVWQCAVAISVGTLFDEFGRINRTALAKGAINSLPPTTLGIPSDQSAPSPLLRLFARTVRFFWAILWVTWILLAGFAAILSLSYPFYLAVPGFIVSTAFIILSGHAAEILPTKRAWAAVAKGNYSKGLRRVDLWDRYGCVQRYAPRLRNRIRLFAGKFDEALISSRAILEKASFDSADSTAVTALETYAEALFGLEKFVEAEEQLENAARISPRGYSPKAALAYFLLHRGKDAERALRLLEEAAKIENKRRFDSLFGKVDHWMPSQIKGDIAWALAALGRWDESDKAMEEAHALLKKEFLPQRARLHYCLGHILILKGKKEAARKEFEIAKEIDPAGAIRIFAERAIKTYRI